MSWNDFEDLPPAETDSDTTDTGPVLYTFTGGVDADTGADMAAAVHEGTHVVLGVLQTWLAGDRAGVLVVQTRGAVGLAGDDITDLAGAAVWGLVRSAQSENPGQVVLIDTDAAIDQDTLAGLLATAEPQLVVRAGVTYGARLTPVATEPILPVPEGQWQLSVGSGGTLEGLELRPCVEAGLTAGQVRVVVQSVGVNFRDVLVTLGMVPGQLPVLGAEGAGVIVEVGPGVSGLAVGDPVMGLWDAAGSVAVTDQRVVVKVPQEWSFSEAASVPVVFLTAYYGLADLARVQAGESVLVHAATGGVGMAAVQLAGHSGRRGVCHRQPRKMGHVACHGIR